MQKKKIIILLTLIFLLVFTLIGCNGNEEESEIEFFDVVFYTNGGSLIDYITVEKGKTLTLPEDPTKTGLIFAGWFLDNNTFNESATDYLTSPILQGATVYARWQSSIVTVQFESNGGSEVADIEVGYNESIPQFDSPTKDGYYFYGWFLDESFSQSAYHLFYYPVQEEVTLYAKWTEVNDNPKVAITLFNDMQIRLELYPEIAPVTVANFLALVNEGYYTNTIFHRIIANFMIQAGMLSFEDDNLSYKETKPTIIGEFSSNGHENNLAHTLGVISMARTTVKDSASAQFFICSATSPHLDGEYAAFGKTIDDASNQMVLALSYLQTGTWSGMNDFPVTPDGNFVLIKSIQILD